MPLGTEGVGRFFGALGGSRALRERAAALGRQDAMREALTDAQISNSRDDDALKNIKISALDPDTLGATMAGIGVDPSQTAGAGGLVRAGQNVNEVGEFMTSLIKQANMRRARDQMANGDVNGANQTLALVDGKPMTLTRVSDGTSYNPNVTPDAAQIAPTDVGNAMIAAHLAAAGASNASAVNSYAGAAQKRTLTPLQAAHIAAETGNVGHVTPTTLPENVADSVLGKVHDASGVATPDPEAEQQFLQWQAEQAKSDPRYLNSSYAIGQYAGNAPVGSKMAAVTKNKDGQATVTSTPLAPAGVSADFMAAIQDARDNPPGKQPNTAALPPESGVVRQPVTDDTDDDSDTPVSAVVPPNTAPAPLVIPANPALASPDVATPQMPQGMATPKSAAEYNALPNGTQYLHPDGTVRVKGGS